MKITRTLLSVTAAMTLLGGIAGCSGPKQDHATENNTPLAAASQPEPQDEATGITRLSDLDTIPVMPDRPIVIDFSATWCGPCREFKPVFEKVAAQYAGKIKFLSADVDECPRLASRYGVTAIPHITIITPDGDVRTYSGYMDESQFAGLIRNLK